MKLKLESKESRMAFLLRRPRRKVLQCAFFLLSSRTVHTVCGCENKLPKTRLAV